MERTKPRLQVIYDGNQMDMSFDGHTIYQGVRLDLPHALKEIRHTYNVGLIESKAVWDNRQEMTV